MQPSSYAIMQPCIYAASNYATITPRITFCDVNDMRCRLRQDMVAHVLLSFKLLFCQHCTSASSQSCIRNCCSQSLNGSAEDKGHIASERDSESSVLNKEAGMQSSGPKTKTCSTSFVLGSNEVPYGKLVQKWKWTPGV